MTASSLRNQTLKQLAQLAKSQGVVGWHSMRKDELIRALLNLARRKRRANRVAPREGLSADVNGSGASAGNPEIKARLRQLRSKLHGKKNLSASTGRGRPTGGSDRLVVMVRDPYWLHVYWEVAPRSIERAQSALGQQWHGARPVLRLYRVEGKGKSLLLREIAIHGGVNHWYVDVSDPPGEFRVEIGYAGARGQFYCLARSNPASTPAAGTSDSVDENWADVGEHADRIFAMSGGYSPRGGSLELQQLLEERLGRPMGSPMQTRFGGGASRAVDGGELPFAVDAELLVYGLTDPQAHVTLQGEPVALREDGSFAVRMSLADRRQVIPVVASSADGVEQRTILLALERNTKVLERVVREPGA